MLETFRVHDGSRWCYLDSGNNLLYSQFEFFPVESMSYLGYFKDVFRYVAWTKSLLDDAFQAGDEVRGHITRLSVFFHLDEE
jgi:hypothetical protein